MKSLISEAHIANEGKWLNADLLSVKAFLSFMEEIPENSDTLVISKKMVDKIRNLTSSGKKDPGQQKKPITGKTFELIMAELLTRHGVTPFYIQATLRHVPLSKFDFLCFHPDQPVIFSTKFSLAERWRQASYEGDSLKRVYRRAECYLVTADEYDADKANRAIENGDSTGIDGCFVMGEKPLIEKLIELSSREFTESELQEPVVAGNMIIPE